MAFLDFLKERNAPQQASAKTQQPEAPARSVESLPDHVRAQAVEAARPAAELMDRATIAKEAPVQPQATPNAMARGRSLGMER